MEVADRRLLIATSILIYATLQGTRGLGAFA